MGENVLVCSGRYVILHAQTLQQVAAISPTTLQELVRRGWVKAHECASCSLAVGQPVRHTYEHAHWGQVREYLRPGKVYWAYEGEEGR